MMRWVAGLIFLLAPVYAHADPTPFEVMISDAFHELAAVKAIRGHADAQSAHAEAKEVWDDPTLSLAASQVPWRELTLSDHAMSGIELKATQPLPYPGKRKAEAELVRRRAEITRRMADPIEVALARKAVGPYFMALTIHRQLPLLREKTALLQELVKLAESRYGAGGGKAGEAMSGRVEWAGLTRRVKVLEAAGLRAVTQFNSVLQRPPDAVLNLSVHALPELRAHSLEQWTSQAQENRPEFMVLTARAKAHHHALELESFRTLPDFSLGGGWRFRTYDGGRDFFSLTVGVELPVWSRSVYGSETAAHREHIAVIEQERLALVREIQGRISVLLREIEMVDVEIEAIVEIERPALNETLAVLRAEYPTGDSEFSDLLRTELRLLELDLRKISLETRRDQLHQELRIESL